MPERPYGQKGRGSGRVLDDYVTWQSGGTPSKANQRYWAGNIPWVTPKDMKWFDLRTTTDYLTPAGVAAGSKLAPQSATYIVVRGMILAHTFPVSQMSTPAAFNQDVKAVAPGPELISRYLAYWFKAHAGDFLRLVGESTHGTKKLDLPDLRMFPMDPPSLTEQARIVEILNSLDAQIGSTKQIIEKYRLQRIGLADHFVMNAANRKGAGILSLGEIVNGRGGFIQTGPFGSQLHSFDYVDDGVPVVMPQDLADGHVNLDSIARVSESKARSLGRHRMLPGDVVFARRGDLERCAEITAREQGWLCGTGCLLVRTPRGVLSAAWLTLVYGHDLGQRHVRANAVGSTMANLNTSILGSLQLPVPPMADQEAAISTISAVDHEAAAERKRLAKLHALKSALMTDLLAGRVRVPKEVVA